MKKIIAVLLLVLISAKSLAEIVSDQPLGVSVNVPSAAKIDRTENDQGRSLIISFHNPRRDEDVVIVGIRANNGGSFGQPKETFAQRMLNGASKKIGKDADALLRTLSYRGKTLFVGSHTGVGENKSLMLTTIYYLEEKASWRKIISVEFISALGKRFSDSSISERLNEISFEPSI